MPRVARAGGDPIRAGAEWQYTQPLLHQTGSTAPLLGRFRPENPSLHAGLSVDVPVHAQDKGSAVVKLIRSLRRKVPAWPAGRKRCATGSRDQARDTPRSLPHAETIGALRWQRRPGSIPSRESRVSSHRRTVRVLDERASLAEPTGRHAGISPIRNDPNSEITDAGRWNAGRPPRTTPARATRPGGGRAPRSTFRRSGEPYQGGWAPRLRRYGSPFLRVPDRLSVASGART